MASNQNLSEIYWKNFAIVCRKLSKAAPIKRSFSQSRIAENESSNPMRPVKFDDDCGVGATEVSFMVTSENDVLSMSGTRVMLTSWPIRDESTTDSEGFVDDMSRGLEKPWLVY